MPRTAADARAAARAAVPTTPAVPAPRFTYLDVCEPVITHEHLVRVIQRIVLDRPFDMGKFATSVFVRQLRYIIHKAVGLDAVFVRGDVRLSHLMGCRSMLPITLATADEVPRALQPFHATCSTLAEHTTLLYLRITAGATNQHQYLMSLLLPRRTTPAAGDQVVSLLLPHRASTGQRLACHDLPVSDTIPRRRFLDTPLCPTSITGSTTHCNRCGLETRLRACSGCWFVRYCGEECWRADWPAHRSLCRSLRV